MKVLIYLGNDAVNMSIEPIVRQLRQKHETRIFSPSGSLQTLNIFTDFMDEIKSASELNKNDYEWADCIFCSALALRKMPYFKKYVFCFCHMNPNFDEARGADFVFTLADINPNIYADVPQYFAYMPVGLAKNDIPKSAETDPKQLLYIDAGHFPFGRIGRRQIAKMLLEICEKFPDYKLVVRPRWRRNATATEMSNINYYHIYDAIEDVAGGELPKNLILPETNDSLQKQIDESACVISSCTSAYLDVAARGKPLLIINGIDNEDMYHLRADYFNYLYQFAEESGCVVDINRVTEYLPEGLNCNPEHLKHAFSYRDGATDRVIEAMEYITENFLSKGLYPAIRGYQYETYREEMESDPEINEQVLLQNRLFGGTETSVALTYKISQKIDWKDFYDIQMMLCAETAENILTGNKKTGYYVNKLLTSIEKEKCRYIVENSELMTNDVDQSYLFYAMNKLGMKAELMEIFDQQDTPNPSLNYYAGIYYISTNQNDKAIACTKNYIDAYLVSDYPRYYGQYIHNSWFMKALHRYSRLLKTENRKDEWYEFVPELSVYASQNPADIPNLITLLLKFDHNPKKYSLIKSFIQNNVSDIQNYNTKALKKKAINKIRRKNKRIIRKIREIMKKPYRFFSRANKRIQEKILVAKSDLQIYNDDQKKLHDCHNIYKGKKAFVIGNGPSLAAADLEKIKENGYICFASNNIYKIYEQTDWRPDVYVCYSSLIFSQNAEEIMRNQCCKSFFHVKFKKTANNMAQSSKDIYYLNYFVKDNITTFSEDCSYIYSGGGVTFVLLKIAYYMGIREVYLIGCDHNFNSFADKMKLTAIESDETTNQDYFNNEYMKKGENINVCNLEKAERGLEASKAYFESHGGHIYNATRGGKLEVFDRIDIDSLLSNETNE